MPSTSAIAVAPRPASIDIFSASRTSSLSYATENHFVLKLSIGQPCVTLSLNAYRPDHDERHVDERERQGDGATRSRYRVRRDSTITLTAT